MDNLCKLKAIALLVAFSSLPIPLWAKGDVKESPKSLVILGGSGRGTSTPFPDDESTKKLFKRAELYEQGLALEKQGLYEAAIEKYIEAMHPSLLEQEQDKSMALGGIIQVLHKQGKFELALKELDWFRTSNPNLLYEIRKPELEALIKARDVGSAEPIYSHINHLKEKYQYDLPPNGLQEVITSDVIRLYDYIGDLDEAIAFVNQVLRYKKLPKRGKSEYEKINRVLEEDRKRGTKGRATQVLIQSDYFPW